MGAFAVGEVVTVPFPFTDQSGTKIRPAIIVADLDGNDSILCAITSSRPQIIMALELSCNRFELGTLHVDPSYALPSKLMVAEDRIIRSIAKLNDETIAELLTMIRDIFR